MLACFLPPVQSTGTQKGCPWVLSRCPSWVDDDDPLLAACLASSLSESPSSKQAIQPAGGRSHPGEKRPGLRAASIKRGAIGVG